MIPVLPVLLETDDVIIVFMAVSIFNARLFDDEFFAEEQRLYTKNAIQKARSSTVPNSYLQSRTLAMIITESLPATFWSQWRNRVFSHKLSGLDILDYHAIARQVCDEHKFTLVEAQKIMARSRKEFVVWSTQPNATSIIQQEYGSAFDLEYMAKEVVLE